MEYATPPPPPVQPQYAPPPPEQPQMPMGYPPGMVPMAEYPATMPGAYPQSPMMMQQPMVIVASPQPPPPAVAAAAEGMCEECHSHPGALRCDRCSKLLCTTCDHPMRRSTGRNRSHHGGSPYMHYCKKCHKKKKKQARVILIVVATVIGIAIAISVVSSFF